MAGGLEPGDITERLYVETDPGHRGINHQRLQAVLDPQPGLVAEREDMADVHGAVLHCQVQADVSTLGHQGYTALHPGQPLLVGPQRRPDRCRDRSVAVGAHQWHVSCSGCQGLLKSDAFTADLGETRRITDSSAGTHLGQVSYNLDRGSAVDGNKRSIWR
ncbi:MAG: hypothetical protein MAG471_00009 [Acidimicrobiaceae bacterium]|nr:hypothetical protein [Acidimicrobiaceae bacterium]